MSVNLYFLRLEMEKAVTALRKLENGKLDLEKVQKKIQVVNNMINSSDTATPSPTPFSTNLSQSNELSLSIDNLLTKIKTLDSVLLYKFTSEDCCVVDIDAYAAYMAESHADNRCISFTEIINNPNGEFMSLYANAQTSLQQKNAKFMELYNTHGTSGPTF